jgi:tetratricopeptide (TPR) repeat protein
VSLDVEAAVVRIRRGDSAVGAGFLAGPGKVLTCAHVVVEALELHGMPAAPPEAELELDFPLRAPGRVLRARVSAECWQPIDAASGRGDVAGLDLLDPAPDGAAAAPLLAEDNLFRHEFTTFGFPAPPSGFVGDPLSEAGMWAHGRILGRQALGHLQLEGTSDSGVRIEPGFSGSPIWDLEYRRAVGMTVTSDQLAERRTAYCIAAADLLAAWTALEATPCEAVENGVLVTFATVDGPWASWAAWWIERQGLPAVVHAVDTGAGEERLRELGHGARLAVAVVSPACDTARAAAAVGGLQHVVAVRVREGAEWPVEGAAASVDLVGRDRDEAHAELLEALASAGTGAGKGAVAAEPAFPPELARLRVDAGATEHRERIQAQNERRRASAGRNVAGRPPLDLQGAFRDRTNERARIRELLADPATRLVTVIGRGGMGKTALACQALTELRDEADTIAVVYLSARGAALGLEPIFRECTSLLEEDERDQLLKIDLPNEQLRFDEKVDRLLDRLGERTVVVLMDNAEDLLGEDGAVEDAGVAAFVERTLELGGHGTRLLVTTREPIALSLDLGPLDRRIPLEAGLPTDDGVAFLRARDPDDRLGLKSAPEDTLALVVERLHGVPRALQLIASLVDGDRRSIDRIAEQFFAEDQVVSQLVEEAYSRLDEDSRTVLCALSVFTRPVPGAAVAAVVEPLAPGLDVERVLRRLARISLLEVDRESETVFLHPVDRDYAESLVPADGPRGRAALEEAAADYWARVRLPEEGWKDIADVEPHLLEIEHRLDAGDAKRAAQVLDMLDGHERVYTWDARRLLALRERLDGKLDEPGARMRHAYGLGQIYSVVGPASRQLECIEEALALARELGDERLERESLSWLGDTHRRLGDQDASYAASAEVAGLYRAAGDAVGESHALSQMSLAESYRGRAEEAIALGTQALEVAAADAGSAGLAHDALTLACYLGTRFEEALDHAEQALVFYAEANVPTGSAYVVNEQGMIYLRLGRCSEAIEALERARVLSEEIGSPRLTGFALFNAAHAYLADGDAETAAERALAAAEALEGAEERGGAEGARALAEAARARAAGDAAAEAQHLTESARAVGWNPDLYLLD